MILYIYVSIYLSNYKRITHQSSWTNWGFSRCPVGVADFWDGCTHPWSHPCHEVARECRGVWSLWPELGTPHRGLTKNSGIERLQINSLICLASSLRSVNAEARNQKYVEWVFQTCECSICPRAFRILLEYGTNDSNQCQSKCPPPSLTRAGYIMNHNGTFCHKPKGRGNDESDHSIVKCQGAIRPCSLPGPGPLTCTLMLRPWISSLENLQETMIYPPKVR